MGDKVITKDQYGDDNKRILGKIKNVDRNPLDKDGTVYFLKADNDFGYDKQDEFISPEQTGLPVMRFTRFMLERRR